MSEIWSWHQAKNKEKESRNCSYYIPQLKPEIHPLLGQVPKKYAAQFFELKVGHIAIGVFLKKIGKRKTVDCWWCRQVDQSVDHLYIKCKKWRRERKVLKKELKSEKLDGNIDLRAGN